MPNKPVHPALAAARIWGIINLTGPAFFVLFIWLYQALDSSLPIFQTDQPDYFQLYSIMLIIGTFLFIIPFFITWAMLSFWKKRRLRAYLMAERLLLLDLVFTVCGITFLTTQIQTLHPLTHAALLFLPYFLAGVLGILYVLGLPYRKVEHFSN
ncbi:MAG: hypothetical protein H6574_03515 [Lewinellaceae bacterium]|nr:hypothetical protein [Saprospiraceae bacterium]MCB9330127.1 hypothetical protein [Lewinellaceae bacterium]